MTLRHLNIFLCVCDENNMTKAAGRLHMTQPSVSLAVQELEEHYQTLLFERLGRRLFITEAGRRLATYARHIVNLNQQTETAMRSFGLLCRLRLGASVTIGESVLVDLLQLLQRANPQQEIFSEIHNTAELETMLLRDELDLALIEGTVQSEYLISSPFMQDELIFIAAPQSVLSTQKKVVAADLDSCKFSVREAGSGTRDLFEQVMQEQKLRFSIAGVYNNAESIKKAVAADLGISVISQRAVRTELARGELCTFRLPGVAFHRTFNIVHHKNKYISSELKAVIELCQKIDHLQ